VGIAIHWRRRAWDQAHFPHATRGYFPFWERIRSAGWLNDTNLHDE
jgi:hypothetical protein